MNQRQEAAPTEPPLSNSMNILIEAEVTCSICGAEHDPEKTPELDSTHLCPDCAARQRTLQHANRDAPSPAPMRPLDSLTEP